MRASVKNFMGIDHVDIDLSNMALVAARNHQGKTSLCRAIGAALSGEVVPLGLKKADAGLLVRTGTAKSEVVISADEGSAIISWPKSERHTEGKPPFASTFATGLANYPELDQKQAIDVLTDLMNARPGRDDLDKALKGIGAKTVDKVWETIDRDGWDLAHKRAVEKGKEFKSQWRYVTDVNYGTKVAASWVPDKWDDSLSGKSKEALDANVTACRAELEDAISQQAIAGDELERLKKTASQKRDWEISITDNEQCVKDAEQALSEAQERRAALPAIDNNQAIECPHCGESVVIDNVWKSDKPLLKKADPVNPKEQSEREMERASLDGICSNLTSKLDEAKASLSKVNRYIKEATEATDKLAEFDGKQSADVDIDACRNALTKAIDDAGAFQKKAEADRLHNNVLANQKIVDALALTGVRKTVLMGAVSRFNDNLKDVCSRAGWGVVQITADMECEFNDRPYVLLAESEKFRAKTSLQMVIAALDNSDMVIVDGADILDADGRKGLLKMVNSLKRPALITMTISKRGNYPDLAAMGLGFSYWLENGAAAEEVVK